MQLPVYWIYSFSCLKCIFCIKVVSNTATVCHSLIVINHELVNKMWIFLCTIWRSIGRMSSLRVKGQKVVLPEGVVAPAIIEIKDGVIQAIHRSDLDQVPWNQDRVRLILLWFFMWIYSFQQGQIYDLCIQYFCYARLRLWRWCQEQYDFRSWL